MQEHMPRNAFDIPKVFYFQAGNTHTGSRGVLRYRVKPSDGILHIEVWRQDLCYEVITAQNGIEGQAEFPISEEGFAQMLDYLQNEYDQSQPQNS